MKYLIDVPDHRLDEVAATLSEHGIELQEPPGEKKGKAQHRWRKAISDTQFEVDFAGCKGTVIWRKPTEMVLRAGATMVPDSEAPRRNDGTLGFTWKVASALRSEHKDAIDTTKWVTTKDIVLRSVNEVGNFLYFAGTNSWLHIHDDAGHTLDELTVVR